MDGIQTVALDCIGPMPTSKNGLPTLCILRCLDLVEHDPDPANPRGIRKSHHIDAVNAVALNLITWTFQHLTLGLSGYYFSTLQSIRRVDVDIFALLRALAYDVGGFCNFSDWPATTTFLVNCGGAFLRWKKSLASLISLSHL